MAVTADLSFVLRLTGDVESSDIFSFVQSIVSPGQLQVVDLASGDNTITIPTGGSSVPVALIIIPPAGNTETLTLKGDAGDTGVAIKPTDPCCISLPSGASNPILNAGGIVTGIRYYFI